VAQIGCLGDIIFQVNSNTVETAKNALWSGSVRYAEHQRHLNNALTEFTGVNADKFSFDMKLLAWLGVDVMAELVKIWAYERKWVTLPLVFGSKIYGKYRWTITNHKINMRYFDIDGNLSGADVTINLLEYLNT